MPAVREIAQVLLDLHLERCPEPPPAEPVSADALASAEVRLGQPLPQDYCALALVLGTRAGVLPAGLRLLPPPQLPEHPVRWPVATDLWGHTLTLSDPTANSTLSLEGEPAGDMVSWLSEHLRSLSGGQLQWDAARRRWVPAEQDVSWLVQEYGLEAVRGLHTHLLDVIPRGKRPKIPGLGKLFYETHRVTPPWAWSLNHTPDALLRDAAEHGPVAVGDVGLYTTHHGLQLYAGMAAALDQRIPRLRVHRNPRAWASAGCPGLHHSQSPPLSRPSCKTKSRRLWRYSQITFSPLSYQVSRLGL